MARQYDYFYGGETEQDVFFRLPKQLIYDKIYCGLSSDPAPKSCTQSCWIA